MYFQYAQIGSYLPSSIGHCKNEKYNAKEPCVETGYLYNVQETFYATTVFYLEGLNTLQILDVYISHFIESYYLSVHGNFSYLFGPILFKFCITQHFCPSTTYLDLSGENVSFYVKFSAICNEANAPDYINTVRVEDLKVEGIKIIKDSGLFKDVDLDIDIIALAIKDKINSILENKKDVFYWKSEEYTIASFINYIIKNNGLVGFTCEPSYDFDYMLITKQVSSTIF